MKKKKDKFLLYLIIALILVGLIYYFWSNQSKDKCIEGKSICNGDLVEFCDAGTLILEQNCTEFGQYTCSLQSNGLPECIPK